MKYHKYPYSWFYVTVICFLVCSFACEARPLLGNTDNNPITLKTEDKDSSAVILLLNQSRKLRSTDLNKSLNLAERAIELSEKIDYQKGVSEGFYHKGSTLILKQSLDSGFFNFKQSIYLAKKFGYQRTLSSAYNNCGWAFSQLSKYDSALYYFEQALKIEEEYHDDSKKLLKRYNNVAFIHFQQSSYKRALNYFFKSLKIAEDSKDEESVVYLLNNIGHCYSSLNEYDLAMRYYKQSLGYDSESQVQTTLMRNMGHLYFKQEDWKNSAYFFKKAIQLSNHPDSRCDQILGFTGMAELMLAIDKVDSALFYAQRAISYTGDCAFFIHEVFAYSIKGKSELISGNLKQAERSFLKAQDLLKDRDRGDFNAAAEVNLGLSELYEKKGDHESALKFYKLFKMEEDSLFSESNNSELVQIEADYQFEIEKELLLKEQEKETALLEKEVSYFKKTRTFIGIALLIILVLVYILFRLYKKEGEATRILSEKNRTITNQQEELMAKADLLRVSNARVNDLSSFKQRLAHMAVHDMKNPLNTIMGLSNGVPTEKKMSIINRSSGQMFNFITNMLDIYKFEEANIVLDLKSHSISDLIHEATEQVELILDEKGVTLKPSDISTLSGIFDGTIMVRVLVNLLTNAIKYSDAGGYVYISTQLLVNDDMCEVLRLTIRDEGEGIKSTHLSKLFEEFNSHKLQTINKSASTGIGLNFCKLAVNAHKGTIEAESEIGKGTSVIINIPLKRSACNGELKDNSKSFEENNDNRFIKIEELARVKEYASILRNYKVYEVGKINVILREMEDENIQSIWKTKVQSIVYAGDNEAFTNVLNDVEIYGQ